MNDLPEGVAPSIRLRCTAGPDAGWGRRLPPGRWWLGRAEGVLSVADPALEAHHAVVEVAACGALRVLQTTGRSPLCVDGVAADGWTDLAAGSVVEVGFSRFEVDGSYAAEAGSTGSVYAPLDGSSGALARFERDLDRVAPALRRAHLEHRPAGTVEVGVASLVLAPRVLDRTGRPVGPDGWSDPVAAAIERRARHEVPLRIELSAGRPVAVVGPHRHLIIDSMLGQLGPLRRAAVLVLDRSESDEFADVIANRDRPVIVGCETVDDVPPWCRALLDVGATWRGTWQPDPGILHRLHAAQMVSDTSRAARSDPPPESETGGSQDHRGRSGPLVAEEVPGAGTEGCRGVVGVPEPTRRQRQAATTDAAVEFVAEPGEDRDLVVEPGLPGARQPRPVLRGRGPPVGQ